jgi:3',5'-cyclic AMP phosphodiesterase CpdA
MKNLTMKNLVIAVVCAIVLLTGCADGGGGAGVGSDAGADGGPDAGAGDLAFPLKVAVLSDTHLYAESLGMCDAAASSLETEPGLAGASEAIVAATIEDLAASDADVVLVSGDLTWNGEAASHERMAELLGGLEAAGKRVYVVPGNHDVDNQYAASYATGTGTAVESVSVDEFAGIYGAFGPDEALSRDTGSLSYVVEPLPGLRFLMLDSCIHAGAYELHGALPADTLAWAVAEAEDAVAAGAFAVAVMHHGLVEHVDSQDTYFAGFLLDDHEAVATALADAGVGLVFTGHYHTRDVSTLETAGGATIADAETGSLTIWPFPYRLVTFGADGSVGIAAATTDAFTVDTGGADIDTWGQARLDVAFEAYLTSIAESYGLTADQIAFAMPTMKDAWKAHLLGDEEYTEARQAAVDEIAAQGGTMVLVAGILAKLYTDAAPADNELVIDLGGA